MQNTEKMLRPKQASDFLGIGISTFWRWVASGKIPQGTRLSARCTVFKLSDLENFVNSRREA